MIKIIVNDKLIWRLLFADTHVVNAVSECAKHLKYFIILNVKLFLTFSINNPKVLLYFMEGLYLYRKTTLTLNKKQS